MGYALTFIGDDAVRNILSLIAISISIVGGRKVLNKYIENRLVSVGGFYARLRIYLIRLEKILCNEDGHEVLFSCGLYGIARNRNFSGISDTDPVYKKEKKRISDFSKSFLDFLMKSDNQYPSHNVKRRIKWHGYLKELIDKLTDMEQLSYNNTMSIIDITEHISDDVDPKRLLDKTLTEGFYDPLINLINNMKTYIDDIENDTLKQILRNNPEQRVSDSLQEGIILNDDSIMILIIDDDSRYINDFTIDVDYTDSSDENEMILVRVRVEVNSSTIAYMEFYIFYVDMIDDLVMFADGISQDVYDAMLELNENGLLESSERDEDSLSDIFDAFGVVVYIHYLAVRDDFRNQGIGDWLLRNLHRILSRNYGVDP